MKRIVYTLLIISAIVTLSSCSRTCNNSEISIVNNKSYFSDFLIDGDVVELYCHVEVNNLSGATTPVQIQGDFEEDMLGGLLSDRFLNAYMADDQSESTFLLEPGINSVDLVFRGKYGGSDIKQNRLLPPIMIIPLEDQKAG